MDGTADTPHGNSRVTRADWLRAARDALVSRGVGEVKILSLSNELGVARSSFYGYFQDREELLDALLAEWEAHNTQAIAAKCAAPAPSINHAICHFFEAFFDRALFDHGLDFAVRDWARRAPPVRAKIDAADAARVAAVAAMFERFDYAAAEADARARILYFMQLGYHALDVREDIDLRLSRVEAYLLGFSGAHPDADLLRAFTARIRALSVP